MSKKLIVFLSVMLTVLMLISSVLAEIGYVLCQPKDYINVRIRPTRKSQAIGYLECGDSVELYEIESNGFIRCRGFECDGWVSKRYIVYEEPVKINKVGYAISRGRLAARKWINGKVRRWLDSGDSMIVFSVAGEWAVTNKGFVKIEYIELEGD